jgi:hypothetical protein
VYKNPKFQEARTDLQEPWPRLAVTARLGFQEKQELSHRRFQAEFLHRNGFFDYLIAAPSDSCFFMKDAAAGAFD